MSNPSELSKKNRYWIPKHRYLELVHFCLQYDQWKKDYADLMGLRSVNTENSRHSSGTGNPTEAAGMRAANLSKKIEAIDQAAQEADPQIAKWILAGVTKEDTSFDTLKKKYRIPCERKMYYNRRRKFFWILSKKVEHTER